MNLKVLVVGGAGYIGGCVTDLLLARGHSVRVYDALVYEDTYLKPVPFVRGDILDFERLKRELAHADAVVWLAAVVADAACDEAPDHAREVNTDSVRQLATTFSGRIVFTSTCSVYGTQSDVLTEDSPIDPRTLYSRTKAAAEQALPSANALILRLATLYGLGDSFCRPRFDLVVNTMTLSAVTKRSIAVVGGEQYRGFLHVRDAAAAIAAAAESNERGVFNLHECNMKIAELADLLRAEFPDLHIERQTPPSDLVSYRVSSEKARRLLAFAPRLRVVDGIRELREVLESGRIKNPSNPRFRNHMYQRAASA